MVYNLTLIPDVTSYAVDFGQEVVYNQLDGGAGRYRRDILKSSYVVTVQWICDPSEYDYLCSFYRVAVDNASMPFTMMLISDRSELALHECYFVPKTFRLADQQGHAYTVTATLEVKQLAPAGTNLDELLVILMDLYGDDFYWAMDLIDQIINVRLPSYIDGTQ